ncbi:ABC transporter substrate-binding protein [Thermogladius sp. 4427co]|uniref:ABC transporter substrate-binding protein n=1 Tax=Thermogladius sp. 4427co TaxID=3450718 RepID=UPI003F7B2F9F
MGAKPTKTPLIIAIVVIIAVLAAGLGYYYYVSRPAPSPAPPKIEKVVIGVVEPLTGGYAIFGQEAVNAAKLVADIINNELGGVRSLGGAKIEIVVEDAGTSPESARLAAEKLISQYHVPIIIGAYISRFTLAIGTVTEQNKVILVSDALVDDLSAQGWMYFFRVAPKASAHGISAVDFVMDMASKKNVTIKTAVIINEDSIFGTTVSNGAHLELARKGVEVLAHISYPYDITDMSPIIDQIKRLNPDIIIAVPYFSDGVLFAKTAKAAGLNPKFIAGAGACGFTDPDSIKAAGDAVLYYTNTYSYNPAKPTDWNRKLVQEFEKRYGKMPTEAGGIIFYSMFTIYEALEKAGQMFPSNPLDPDNLRQAFLSLDLNETNSIAAQLYPTGRIKFAPNGDNLYAGTAILQVQLINGTLTPVVVWPQPQPGVQPIFPRPGS